jgi:carboxymethylenebutenolidase
MRSTRTFWGALLALPLLAGAAAAQGKVKTSDVSIKSGKETIKGFLAEPVGKGPFPAVVVIQEWWGLNDWIKDNAKRLAGQGFVALAPDLYRGKVATDPKTAGSLAKGLPKDRAVQDLAASVDHLEKLKNVDKGRIGSIGWCMGGGYSLELALNDPAVKACVICYGRLVTDPMRLRTMKAKVLGVFGEDDKGIPAKSVREFESALKEAGTPVERVHIFPGAGHGFMRENNPTMKNPEYREMQAREAWQEIEAFLTKTLKK